MLDATARTLQYALDGLTMRQTPTDVESPRGTDLSNPTYADNLTQAASATTAPRATSSRDSGLSSVQNVDTAQALTDLKTAESSDRAALYATAQTNRQSLVNFLS
jgi:hypothetical protein